ncbi:hypothetical protein P879_08912 [Paragonimus westermani]|uniref:MD-2-related lipid-recognition domain-containing protein n=1 Tax=Paragonimus westermani TaxID=34504 RepID=A0A8T0DJF3_9TREM|nr:hypothetical protein P879_08912 [Paragonimus westermani]
MFSAIVLFFLTTSFLVGAQTQFKECSKVPIVKKVQVNSCTEDKCVMFNREPVNLSISFLPTRTINHAQSRACAERPDKPKQCIVFPRFDVCPIGEKNCGIQKGENYTYQFSRTFPGLELDSSMRWELYDDMNEMFVCVSIPFQLTTYSP